MQIRRTGEPTSTARQDAADAADKAFVDGMAKAQAATPGARVVMLPRTNHYIYIANEADVLREMRAFLSKLP